MEKKCMTMRLELIDNGSSDTNEDNMAKMVAIARTSSGSMQGRREQRCADIDAILKERVNL
jgi:hypothetical protein